MKSIKLWSLIVLKFIGRSKKFFIFSLILLTALTLIQLKFKIFFDNNTIRLGLVGTFQEHDLPDAVTRLVSKDLISLSMGWEVNNDATEFKFKLKDDVRWSDGTLLTSSDLEINIPDTESSAPDESSVRFKLKQSYSPFVSLLKKPLFKKGAKIGTGPYQITKIEKSRIFITKMTLEPQRDDLPKIIIRFYPSEKVAKTGFDLGEAQALLGISEVEGFGQNSQVAIRQETDYLKMVTVLYNVKDPLLSNRSLRQALSYQAPKIEGEEEANNPYPKNSWAYDASSKKYLDNPQEAKGALGRAKASLSQEKLGGEIILTTTDTLKETGEKVVQKWKELGFDVKLRVESGIPQNFQALLITQSIPEDPDQYFLWHSTQEKTNLTKYSSARVDKDLEDGRKALTQEERKQKYDDFQATLLEDTPATFLYFPKYNTVYLKKVGHLLEKVLNL